MVIAPELKHPDRLFIDGAWSSPSAPGAFDVLNASTEEVLFRAARATSADGIKNLPTPWNAGGPK